MKGVVVVLWVLASGAWASWDYASQVDEMTDIVRHQISIDADRAVDVQGLTYRPRLLVTCEKRELALVIEWAAQFP